MRYWSDNLLEGVLEVAMLICFAAAWPFSIYKLWKTKNNGGKSIVFSYIIILGYICGIANKFVMNEINFVLGFYLLDVSLVIIDTVLYYRNIAIAKRKRCPS